ncbi:MAG: pentapeptide repeat-containing protein [Acidobacteria bacterium]|nr:pentapeptide repeat-containing protein [Acidobacteriota bacterium]
MSSNQHGLNVTKPVSLLNRSLKFSFKEFFKSMTKAVVKGATANYAQALGDVVDALASVSLVQDCGEVAWLLIQRSLLQAVHDLLKENEPLIYRDAGNPMVILSKRGLPSDDPEAVTARLDLSLEQGEITIDENFFRNPRTLPVLEQFKTPFRQWLELFGLNTAEADSIANRLPSYFVHALNEQWRARPEEYRCLKEAFDTPFTKAGAAEQAWQSYAALLQKQVDEPMFVEAFSLRQVYVPLRAYYLDKPAADKETRPDPRAAEATDANRIVIDLKTELDAWLANNDSTDAVRVISGGPGSGKSSFTKMLAAKLAEQNARRVLFVPLHLLEISDDLEDAVKKFIRYIDRELTNPLDPEESVVPSLIIFDGLDELAMQGKIAAELAQQFVREVRDKIERLNYRGSRLKVLISGRELSVQSNTSDFKRPKQVLHVLPYFVSDDSRKQYADARSLLKQDQRQQWWANYGKVSGNKYKGLPKELGRDELSEITSQPLLNYLVALSFTRGEVDLATESNLNIIYRDLLKAVYNRGWAGGRNLALQGVAEDKFVRWLEEIAVAAWHGDGRTTTLEEIKSHTESGGAANLLNLFEEGADKGITRLLMAFYFRRAGVRESGEKTFEFTHKSFGEYLTAKRIVRLLGDMHEELERHGENVDKGWDERAALVRWIKLCGQSPLDRYIFQFMENEVRSAGASVAVGWQETLCKLIEFELRQGLPMEQVGIPTFKEQTRQARNVEESLIAALSACARVTEQVSKIEWPTRFSFAELLSRLQSQPLIKSVFIFVHLNYLDVAGCILAARDLRGASFYRANLDRAYLNWCRLEEAQLGEAKLRGALLGYANLGSANLNNADLERARLYGVDFGGANLRGGNFKGADLRDANLSGANLKGADFSGALLANITFDDITNFVGAGVRDALFDRDEQKQNILKLAGA